MNTSTPASSHEGNHDRPSRDSGPILNREDDRVVDGGGHKIGVSLPKWPSETHEEIGRTRNLRIRADLERGEMGEWSMAVVLKTIEPERVPGFESLSLRHTSTLQSSI